MAGEEAIHLLLYQECLILATLKIMVPRLGSPLARNLPLRDGDQVLGLGAGTGLIGILAARLAQWVVAKEVVPAFSESARANAFLNGVADRVEVRTGDLFASVGGETFDVISTNPPRMPTPPDREWDDAQSRADDGGPDGRAVLDRNIHETPLHLKLQGRRLFALFGILAVERALETLRVAGLGPRGLAREERLLPRIAQERLEHFRSLDAEKVLSAGRPATCRATSSAGRKASRCPPFSSSTRMTSI